MNESTSPSPPEVPPPTPVQPVVPAVKPGMSEQTLGMLTHLASLSG